jgi:plastocyanin
MVIVHYPLGQTVEFTNMENYAHDLRVWGKEVADSNLKYLVNREAKQKEVHLTYHEYYCYGCGHCFVQGISSSGELMG